MPQGGLSLLASALASAPSLAELLPALLLGLLDAGALHRLVPDVLFSLFRKQSVQQQLDALDGVEEVAGGHRSPPVAALSTEPGRG